MLHTPTTPTPAPHASIPIVTILLDPTKDGGSSQTPAHIHAASPPSPPAVEAGYPTPPWSRKDGPIDPWPTRLPIIPPPVPKPIEIALGIPPHEASC
ncbi:hypothetical protein I316_07733 [Kwoniella heveanensis BCC8398]|uniref:Uncharacterized protein n=1 Tax=Kwoniella heveanensis BCC8398 TaxID=1296120 RepID=A0A1B9GHY4_9TREE|nr:hypothetical protein I316_07733 [Kwoniella heveanensis BCC8398]